MEFLDRLNSEQLRLVVKARMIILAYIVLLVAVYFYVDNYAYDDTLAIVSSSILVYVMGYLLFHEAMRLGGYFQSGRSGGFLLYFLLGVIVVVAVTAGLILLILPGFYLLLRWQPAYARLMMVGGSPVEALRWSWHKTEPYQREIGISLLGPLILTFLEVAPVIGYDLFEFGYDGNAYIVMTIGTNLALAVSTVWFTVLGIAVYGCIELEEFEIVQAFD